MVYRDARDNDQGAGYNDDIYGQRLSCDGTRLLEEDLPISTQYSPAPAGNRQNEPAVAYDAWHDHYLVVWQDERNDPDASSTNDHLDIYGQVLSGDGTPLFTADDSNFAISTAVGNQHQPDTAFSARTGVYLAVWVDQRGADADIYGRFLGPTGALWGQEVVIGDAPDDQLAPAVTYNGDDDHFLVVWQDQRDEATSGADIYDRLLVPPEIYRQYLPLVSRNDVTIGPAQNPAERVDDSVWDGMEHAQLSSGISPTLQLVAFQPSDIGYLFTARVDNALPRTQYVISSFHHTDIDYWQDTITVTTDSAGAASAQIWSRCSSGYAFARLSQANDLQAASNLLDCPSIQTIGDFGSQLANEPANDDWIYRPSPLGSDTVDLWILDAAARAGLTATVSIQSAKTGYLLSEESLTDESNGLYTYAWPIGGLSQASDYRVQLTLDDGAGGLGGADALVKLSGRAMWIWGQAQGDANPTIWALLTNEDQDGNGKGDRDEWLAFCNAPSSGPDPYVTTNYLSVYPYLNYSGTQVADTFRSFLTVAHATGSLRVEALAGTHEWVESDDGLQDGQAMCQAIVAYNRDDAASDVERFDGIHLDVEHDVWTAERWARYLDLLATCQAQVDAYNQSHEAIVLGVDIPPHFLTGPASAGQVESAWDVLGLVDHVTLMDYRDFADVRPGDGRTDGIVPRAVPFVVDGNTLGKPIIIGVELTPNPYDHVTFYEECPAYMEAEIGKVSLHFAREWAYRGIAIHSYDAWKGKGCVFLPLTLKWIP